MCFIVWARRQSILAHPRIKLKEPHVRPVRVDKLVVLAPDDSKLSLMFALQQLMGVLPKVRSVVLRKGRRCSSSWERCQRCGCACALRPVPLR